MYHIILILRMTGGILTAFIALGVLLYLNWLLTLFTVTLLLLFGGSMATAFNKLRPLFRERGKINADVTGRLGESLSGVRIVKAYTAERGENRVFAKGVHRLFRNVGIGRDAESLMLMVTPRIIIQEEEEEKLGITPPS